MSQLDLIGELRRGKFEHALLTTYEFSADFFEGYCLRSLDACSSVDNMVVFLDDVTYAELLTRKGRERPRLAGRSYYLAPAHARGAFHPKVYLFANKRRGLLIIGSCNLTKTGLSSNAEFAGCFRFDLNKDDSHGRLFADVYRWFCQLGGPPSVLQAVEAVGQDCAWLRQLHAEPGPAQPRFLSNLDEPLWGQLCEIAGPKLSACTALSPYFDRQPKLLDELDELPLHIYSERGGTTMTPAWLEHPRLGDGSVRVTLTRYDDDGHPRRLHAKALVLHGADSCLLAYGSANFTTPALFATPSSGNCECMLAIPGLPANFDVASLFDPSGQGTPARVDELGERNDDYSSGPTLDLRLAELTLDGTGTFIASLAAVPERAGKLFVIIEVADHEPARLGLRAAQGQWRAQAPEALVQRCARLPALGRVEHNNDDGEALVSNTVFLHNLVQLDAGADRRLNRRVQVALESAEQFHAELTRLLEDGSDVQLARFFQLCNISISSRPRLRRGRLARPGAGPDQRGRVMGRRARVLALSLHDAAIDFIDRHRRRLSRHARDPSIEGIPAFMHVVRAIFDVCDSQIERMVAGLDQQTLRPREWKTSREFFTAYLVRAEKVMALVVDDYLPALARCEGSDRAGPELRVDVAALRERCEALLRTREAVERAAPVVRTDFGQRARAGYFRDDLLKEGRWEIWCSGMRHSFQRLEASCR